MSAVDLTAEVSAQPRAAAVTRTEAWLLLTITALALVLRAWALGAKGLWYDEAATLAFARAPVPDIVAFHWQSAFEHPPVWAVLMHYWVALFGQSAAALRWPSALAGAAMPWATWLLGRAVWPRARVARLAAALLVAISPILIQFGQEARMYALAGLLSILSLALLVRLMRGIRPVFLVLLVLVNWLMAGLQYYYALLFVVQGLILIALLPQAPRRFAALLAAVVVSAIPTALWVGFSPGFRATFATVTGGSARAISEPVGYLARVWRDFAYGSVSFQPAEAKLSYVLLPLFVIGLVAVFVDARRQGAEDRDGLAALPPLLVSTGLLVPVLATGVISLAAPLRWYFYATALACLLLGLAVEVFWRWRAWAGVLALILTVAVFGWADRYYYSSYQKSQYREAAAAIAAHAAPGDALVLEPPRQHLLAKVYMPDLPLYTVPAAELPEFWPVTAPPVVPQQEDSRLRDILAGHNTVWLVQAGEDEVDKGEFVRRYLGAVGYELKCDDYLDAKVCRYVAPARITGRSLSPVQPLFGDTLQARAVSAALLREATETFLTAQFDWRLQFATPRDYVVTLRLLDAAGHAVAQLDRRPIGDLLPTPTWGAGDEKPGYFSLPLPPLAPGDYVLQAGVYDAATRQLVPIAGAGDQSLTRIACLRVERDQPEMTPCAAGG